nr:uncharacterized protein LOC109166971 [Ipomoea trifida]
MAALSESLLLFLPHRRRQSGSTAASYGKSTLGDGFLGSRQQHVFLFLARGCSGVSMEYKKEKEKRVGRRSSRRLAEQARQEMLKARKAAHGGHEVGDTSTDPLVLTSEDEEMETPPPAMERVPENQQNDADYVLFLLKQSENEGQRNISSPNSSTPTQESSYSPSGYDSTPPRAKSKASKGTASSSRKK